MSETTTDATPYQPILTLSAKQVRLLADRLYARGISTLTIDTPVARHDLITASRALRRLLVAFERAAGHELHTIRLSGVV
jgi:hypothetical protein